VRTVASIFAMLRTSACFCAKLAAWTLLADVGDDGKRFLGADIAIGASKWRDICARRRDCASRIKSLRARGSISREGSNGVALAYRETSQKKKNVASAKQYHQRGINSAGNENCRRGRACVAIKYLVSQWRT